MSDDGTMDEQHAPSMTCGFCGEECPWNLFGRCSWECFDQDRADPGEHAAMIEAAPEALAFFMGLGPARESTGSTRPPACRGPGLT